MFKSLQEYEMHDHTPIAKKPWFEVPSWVSLPRPDSGFFHNVVKWLQMKLLGNHYRSERALRVLSLGILSSQSMHMATHRSICITEHRHECDKLSIASGRCRLKPDMEGCYANPR